MALHTPSVHGTYPEIQDLTKPINLCTTIDIQGLRYVPPGSVILDTMPVMYHHM